MVAVIMLLLINNGRLVLAMGVIVYYRKFAPSCQAAHMPTLEYYEQPEDAEDMNFISTEFR
jgi:hypothetical protein